MTRARESMEPCLVKNSQYASIGEIMNVNLGLFLAFIAGAVGAWCGGMGGLLAVVIGQIGIAISLKVF